GGHGDEDVVGEQGDDGVHVGGFVGGHEPGHDGVLGGGVGGGVSRGEPASEGGAGSFEGAGDRLEGRVEQGGDLGRREAEHVAQDEDGYLAGRQQLQSRDEGQGDGLGLLVAGFGAEGGGQGRVGEGLEPDDLTEAGGLGRFDAGDVPRRGGAPACR